VFDSFLSKVLPQRPTKKPRWKHDLLGGGNSALFAVDLLAVILGFYCFWQFIDATEFIFLIFYQCCHLVTASASNSLLRPVGERCIVIGLSVCEHVSRIAGPIFTKFLYADPCGRDLALLWQRCDTLCTSGFMDDVTFGRSGPYGDAWKAEPLTYYH